MNKPWIIWGLSALCAALVFGAMGIITQHTLGLEKERAEADARAELQERIRLSLWRMDSAAAGILAEENNRPAWHFRDVDLEQHTKLTPLNFQVPNNVKLHFEINDSKVSSPQFNRGLIDRRSSVLSKQQLLRKSEANYFLHADQIRQGAELTKQKEGAWNSLNGLLLKEGVELAQTTITPTQEKLLRGRSDNWGIINAVAFNDASEADPLIEADLSVSDSVVVAQEQRGNQSNLIIRNNDKYQQDYSLAEKSKRQQIVQKSVKNPVAQPKWAAGEQKKDAKNSKEKKAFSKGVSKAGSKPVLRKVSIKDENLKKEATATDEEAASISLASEGKPADASSDSQKLMGDSYFSALKPIWLGKDLMLIRTVQNQSQKRIQGVWLDSDKIRVSLLKDIVDLLPDAELEPAQQSLSVLLGEEPDPNADDAMVMAALPWRLIPGEAAVAIPVGWTPMRKTLGVAWVGALLAALAAVVLLRGVVKLSERRASFVSSVTHELRTPLTTFGLYSDMLAEGMVKDEKKQKDYLQTLRKESSRLTHLVENVLAYSRIERGSARTRVEKVQVGELIHRICERLSARADEAGMQLFCKVSPGVEAREIEVDTTAVEQILFNLVDNASKYASGDEWGNTIELLADESAKGIVFQVSDKGPGIKKSERRKLFRAFHKSAQEAAHTKPGVGLGLALCRRLARALRGDLRIVDQKEGACFELLLRQ